MRRGPSQINPLREPESKPLSSAEACAVLGAMTRSDGRPISRRTLTRYKRQGLPYVAVHPNVYREQDLKRWLEGKRKGFWI